MSYTRTSIPRQHGMGKTRIYAVWNAMRARCSNPNNGSYADYGARGITVCERWQKFENFLADMGVPAPGMTLERKDNDLCYSPDNCVWAPRFVQNRNTRRNLFITYQGRTQILTDWARELDLPLLCIWKRLNRGWSVDRAFTQPVRKANRV